MPAKTFAVSSEEHYRRVADIYRDAMQRGATGPSAEVARQLGVPPERARTWVSKARQRGFLGEALGHKAGEQDLRFEGAEGQQFVISLTDTKRGYDGMLHLKVEEGSPRLVGLRMERTDGEAMTAAEVRSLPVSRWTRSAIAAAGTAAKEGRYEASVEVER